MIKTYTELERDGVRMRIASIVREGTGTPILLLHGFGSTKEDFADLVFHPGFHGRPIIAYDAPGFGETECESLSDLSVPFLQGTAEAVIAHHSLRRFHLVGHSMGGLTALLLALDNQDAVASFTNIEGNLSPEDCFLSRQIIEYPANGPDEFLAAFVERTAGTPTYSSALYAAGLRCKVRPDAIPSLFRSIVDISDNASLLEKFVTLRTRKLFVYGSMNRSLSYLETLRRHGVRLAEIPRSGHFPMYANPPALWSRLSEFLEWSGSEEADDEP